MTNASEYAAILTAQAWRPEAGETLTGIVANLRRQDDDYGGHIVVTLNTNTPEQPEYRAVHAFHTVLKKQLGDLRPSIGDPLRFTYLGKVEGKNQPYHSWLALDPTKEPDEFTWDDTPEF